MDPILASLVLLIPGLLGLAIPALTELVTKVYAPDGLKSAVAIALALLAAAVGTVPVALLATGTVAGIGAYFSAVLIAWLVSGRAYLAGLGNKAAMVLPGTGLGSDLPATEVDHDGDEVDHGNSPTV